MANWYINNVATGINSGRSWADAWNGFSSVNWSMILPGDTLYLSGGATERRYFETLSPSLSGIPDHPITIDVGANSPEPAGHDGIVVLDGEKKRDYGLLLTGDDNDLVVNGLDKQGNYKFEIRNIFSPVTQPHYNGAIYQYNGDRLNINGIKIPDVGCFAINLYQSDRTRIANCIVTSIEGLYSEYRPECLYAEGCVGLVIENNYMVTKTTMQYQPNNNYSDVIQVANVTDLTMRNNWLECKANTGNENCGTLMIGQAAVRGNSYIYNNVIIGNTFNPNEMCQIYSIGVGNLHFYNNTLVAQNSSATMKCLHVNRNGSQDGIAGIKNNVIVTPNGLCMVLELGLTPTKSDNNLFYTANPKLVELQAGMQKSWAQWQAAGYDPHGVFAPSQLGADYKPLPTSPCIQAGADLSAYFTVDKDGNPRPKGTPWTVGAYEYVEVDELAELKGQVDKLQNRVVDLEALAQRLKSAIG